MKRMWTKGLPLASLALLAVGLTVVLLPASPGAVPRAEAAGVVGGTCYDWSLDICYRTGYYDQCNLRSGYRWDRENPWGQDWKTAYWCGDVNTPCDLVATEFTPCNIEIAVAGASN